MDDASHSQYRTGHSNTYRYIHHPDRYARVPSSWLRARHALEASRPVGVQAFVPVIACHRNGPRTRNCASFCWEFWHPPRPRSGSKCRARHLLRSRQRRTEHHGRVLFIGDRYVASERRKARCLARATAKGIRTNRITICLATDYIKTLRA